jgi:beta-glucosidase
MMTLQEKIAFLGLQPIPALRIEEENPGVPRLCIPPLVVRDGPVGVAADAGGVTAFPSEISLASTFNPQAAEQYGYDLGREAREQGTMGIQGPGLDVSVYDNWGRSWENLGEDPTLTSVLGAKLVEGIQQTGEFAMVKHLGAYVQESGRTGVNAIVSTRANEEIYLAPFRAAVGAGASSIMCAVGSTNGRGNCANSATIAEMHKEGFDGFIRTDAGASTNEVASLKSGVDLFRPYDPAPIQAAVTDGALPVSVINRAVRDVLSVMFRYHDVQRPIQPNAGLRVTDAQSVATSLSVAEQSMVLLKNNDVLPLGTQRTQSIAVIGAAAALDPIDTGSGSSQVQDPTPITDLAGIEPLGAPSQVTYTPASSTVGLTTLSPGVAIPDPSVPGYQEASLSLPTTIAGLVDFSYASMTPTQLDVDGTTLLQNLLLSSGLPITFEKSIELSGGPHDVTLIWPDGQMPPTVTAQTVDPLIQQAAAAASTATTAIVVVGERDGEGFDRSSLALPGYQDQLIEAVAAANPHTIVVIHSGGPVLMPWLGSVAGVLEAWYPGEIGGAALKAVLSGAVDPSGRLPVAFPTSDATAPMILVNDWPSLPSTANLVALGDLGVGSEWYTAHDVVPLFSFGFGLSYTSFSLGQLAAKVVGSNVQVSLPVTNTGFGAGRYVGLADVTYPIGSGEPPGELKGFGSVSIAPHRSGKVTFAFPLRSLETWQGSWGLPLGSYTLSVGGDTTTVELTNADALVLHVRALRPR